MSDFLNQFGKSNYQKGSSIAGESAEVGQKEQYRVYSQDEYDEELEFDEIVYVDESDEFGEAEHATDAWNSRLAKDGKDAESFDEAIYHEYQDNDEDDDDFKKALLNMINQLPDSDSDTNPDIAPDIASDMDRDIATDIDRGITSDIDRDIASDIDRDIVSGIDRDTDLIRILEPPMFNSATIREGQGYGEGGIRRRNTEAMAPVMIRPRQNQIVRHEPKGKIMAPSHVVVKDTGHHKRQMVRYGIIGLGIIAVALIAWFVFDAMNRVEVPDFVGTPLSNARGWELTNRVAIDAPMVFDLEYDDGIIISQETSPQSIIRRGGVLRVTVSLGPDPDELIPLPDFTVMNTAQVRAWRSEVRGLNVSINEEFNTTVAEGGFIRMEFVNTAVTAETYTRQDGLLIFMSRGEEVFPENIVVPNFVGRTRADVDTWAEENNIIISYEEEVSDTVAIDLIISQSIEHRRRIARYTEMTITISLGNSITIPDFSGTSEEEAMRHEGMQITALHRYHGSVPFGVLISQSIAAGEVIIGETPNITLTYSLGRPFLEDLIGTSEGGLAERFHQFTSRGADITYTVVHVNSWHPRGQIVDITRRGEHLGMTEHITIWVSLENMSPPEPPTAPPAPPDDNGGD
jgi:serine/threonine-protein kinase